MNVLHQVVISLTPEDKDDLQFPEIKLHGLVAMRRRPLTSPRLDFGVSAMV